MDEMDEIKLPIGPEEVAEAAAILQKYKAGKAALDKRLVDNELWFRMGHWKNYQNPMMEGKPQTSSGWLFNSIANKHADAMDNYPSPNVLPRAEDDEAAAQALSSVLPVVLEQADYEQVYSDTWWRKLKQGTGVKGIFWDPEQHGGVGEIAIHPMNLLMLYWEPGVEDIQASPHFFSLNMENTKQLEARWPQLKGHSASVLDVPRFIHDGGLDTSEKSVVVDWYYKKPDENGRVLLHYCKFCNGVVLYASENDPALAGRGFYDHGKYPFVFDPLFMEEDSPAGFGYIDVMKECQNAIDRMNHAMDENVLLSSKQRYVLSDTAGVNEEELADFSRDIVHVVGRLNDDSFRPLQTAGLQGNSLSYRASRIEELKEISGNRDMTQGGTAGGVTAASAIAALQEAGSKLSRDMLKSAYRAFAKECYLILDLMRQFYDEERVFRIVGGTGENEFVPFSGAALRPQPGGAFLVAGNVVFQHGDPALAAADLLGDAADIPIQAFDRNGQLLCLHPDLLSLALGGFCGPVEPLVIGLSRLIIPHLTADGFLGPVDAVGPEGNFQRPALVPQSKELLGLGALFFQRADTGFQFAEDVPQPLQILRRSGQAPFGLVFAVAVLGDAAGFLKNFPALGALGRHDLRNAALPDDGIAVAADAGIQQQFVNILQAADLAVDAVLALAGAVVFAADHGLVGVQIKGVGAVVQRQAHLCKAHGSPAAGAAEDDVFHLPGSAQLAGAGLAQHPPHRVRQVRLAGTVGPDHAGHALVKGDLDFVREALEPLNFQFLEYHPLTFPSKRPAV